MVATSNASRLMHDEITLVKEDRVVLEMHNQQITTEKEETESKLKGELMGLKVLNSQLQRMLKKQSAEHEKEIKAKNRYIKNFIECQATTAVKACQADLGFVNANLPVETPVVPFESALID